MASKKVKQGSTVIAQLMDALGGISQGAMAREWNCTKDKIWRSLNGTEPTFTAKEVKHISRWLKENFGKEWEDLPDSLISEDPVPFLQKAIELQSKQNSEE